MSNKIPISPRIARPLGGHIGDSRRTFLKEMAATVAAWKPVSASAEPAQKRRLSSAEPHRTQTVRDKLWIWSLVAGMYNDTTWFPGKSRITPVEAACYLGVPNVCMVTYKMDCKLKPAPPYDEYAIALLSAKRVIWALGGAGRRDVKVWLDDILKLSETHRNIVGIQMDDFYQSTLDGGETGSLTPKELSYVKERLRRGGDNLELWVTLYHHDLKYEIAESLDEFDVVTYWTWNAKDLETLEQGFAQVEKAAPHARKLLGCYMWDFGDQTLMPITLMHKQCELGLSWIRGRRLDGIIFGISNLCDLKLEAVEWTRNWVREVGGEELSPS
jgi:hypothetical protein